MIQERAEVWFQVAQRHQLIQFGKSVECFLQRFRYVEWSRIAIVDCSRITHATDDLLDESLDQLALMLKTVHAKFYDRCRGVMVVLGEGGK